MTTSTTATTSTTPDLTQQAHQELRNIPSELRAANTVVQANSVTAVYGITGSGKSSLGDTAAEYCWERFNGTTLCYATDPGGFGNKRLSLIRLGIMKVWDPTNHVRPFETMELISLGAWPLMIEDPERGYADPHVPLVLPRQLAHLLICPQGHQAARFDNDLLLQTAQIACPTCGVVTSLANAQRVEKVIVKSKLFHSVGLRIYDSVTAMNDRGLLIELPGMSARGELPTGREGGAALGSADAIRQGSVVYGTGSKSQVGFMQNRSYGWLVNIRQIPDQVVPAIAMFGVEQSKVDDESGGEQLLGPKIAGNARTSAVGGWVGNLLHASLEPDEQGHMRHRLWLKNHIDPRRPDRIPYVAKHRGTPLGMPEFLEDPWHDDPATRADHAWSQCSLKRFFELLEEQFEEQQKRDRAKYPNAPALQADAAEPQDEILPVTGAAAAGVDAPVPVSGGRTVGRRAAGRRPTVVPAAVTTATTTTSSAPTPDASAPTASAAVDAPSPIRQQLDASVAAIDAAKTVASPAPATPAAPAGNAPPAVSVTAATSGGPGSPPAASTRLLRRVPRPPAAAPIR